MSSSLSAEHSNSMGVTESFLGSLFESEPSSSLDQPSQAPSAIEDLPTIDTKVSIASNDGEEAEGSSWWTKIRKFFSSISPRVYYIIGAILVLCLIVYLYRTYSRKSLPHHEHYHGNDHNHNHGHDHFHMPTMPTIPVMPSPPPPPQPHPARATLLDLEQQLAQNYTQFQESANTERPDPRVLETWLETMTLLYQKLKQTIDTLIQSNTVSIEEQPTLLQGLQDAEVILVNARSKVEERKRLAMQEDTDKETTNVVKNMHHMGFGNKIKNVKPQAPPIA